MFHEEGGSSTKTCQEGQIMEKKPLSWKMKRRNQSTNHPSCILTEHLLGSNCNFTSLLARWGLSSWSTCASWSSPPSSPRPSSGRTPWWGSSALATCPTTPRSPATASRARATRRCCATSATCIASSRAGCRGYTRDGTGLICWGRTEGGEGVVYNI